MRSRLICRGFQRFLEDTLISGKASFQDLWDSVYSSFMKLAAQLANQNLFQPLLGAIFGTSNSNTLSFAGQAGSNSPLLGFLSGGNGPFSFLNFGGQSGPLSNLFGSGGVLGSLGVGASIFSAGSMLSTMLFGNKGDTGLLGGLLGIGGGFIGSLTGSSNHGAISNFTDGGLGNTLFKAGGGNNGAMATAAATQINQAIKTLQDAGVSVSLGNISGLSIGSDKSYVYDFAGGKQKLAGGEAGVQATVNAILERILPSASGTTADAQALLSQYGGLNAGNFAGFISDIQAQQAQKAQDAQIAAAKAEADAAEAAAKAADDAAAEIKALSDAMDAMAETVAAAQDQLVKSYNAERDAIQATISSYQEQAASLRNYLAQVGGSSSDPLRQYALSKSAFNSTAELARGGDLDAMARLPGVGSAFEAASKAASQSLAQYRSDRALITRGVTGAIGSADSQVSTASRQMDALNASVEGLITLNETTMSVKEAIEALQKSQDELAKQTADSTAKIAKLLTNVTRDGSALVTEAA